MKDTEILKLLRARYERGGFLCYGELRIGTGYGKNAEQRIDFWAINPMPASNLLRVACEIKISRSDWLRELKQPMKRRRALMLSNQFYIVAPVGIVKKEELPLEAGLMEVYDEVPLTLYRGDDRLHIAHLAPERDGMPPSWRFVAGLLRRDLHMQKLLEEHP